MSSEMFQLRPTKYTLKKRFCIIKENELVFRHGHIAITNYKMGDNVAFEKSLSIFDEMAWKYDLVGGYYVKELKEFRINRGYDVNMLAKFFPGYKVRVDNDPYPSDKVKIDLFASPRDDFQKVALTFMASQGEYKSNSRFTQQLIDADTGDGKSQPDDTPIPTPNGLQRLDSLSVGDYVFNAYGELIKILAIYPQKGLQETYAVTFSDGRTTRCNSEHLWTVCTSCNRIMTIPLSEIIKNYKDDFGHYEYSVQLPKPVQYNEIKTKIKPDIMGTMIGNHQVDNYLKIPDEYLYNSINNRVLLFRGLFFSDSCIHHDGHSVKFLTISKQMQDDIVELTRSLGYLSYPVSKNAEYYVTAVSPDAIKHGSKYLLNIINIEKIEPTMQRCILVDDPSHVYITENFIPTHNTYCGVASTCFLSARTIIIMPFAKLLDQWKQSYLNFTSISESEIMIVQGSKACKKILDGKCKHIKVFLFMTDTLDSFHKQYGNMETIELLRATNCYTKITDEVHRNFKTNMMIEALCNFHMNYYMSASPGRTEKKENWIFKTVFRNVPRFGSGFKKQDEKHINIIIKKYQFVPTPQQIGRMLNKRKKWLNTKSYEKELIHAPLPQRESFESAMETMLKWSKSHLKKENRIMILMNTIDGTMYAQQLAEKVFPGETSHYYGTMKSDEEKKAALEKRIICATTTSLGTGADIANIQFVYNCATYSNWVDAMQISGRARKLKDGTQVVYVEFVNFSYQKTFNQFMTRKPYLEKRAKTGKLMMVD